MEKLSIEQKAARYDEVIEGANALLSGNQLGNAWIYKLLPELAEPEDERIRKAILWCISTVKHELGCKVIEGFTATELKSWVEKQGKHDMGISESTKQELEDNLNKALAKETPETYNEFLDGQKHGDKTEPMFNVGDWVTNGKYLWEIVNLTPLDYIMQSQNGEIVYDDISYVDKEFRIWSLQDAKECDALVTKNHNIFIFKEIKGTSVYDYCGLYFDKLFVTPSTVNGKFETELPKDYVPATKEQRDLLFSKMKETGYEWDAEKKELKKIEQKPIWSEEDETKLTMAQTFIRNTSLVGNDGIKEATIDWLKSLKERMLS